MENTHPPLPAPPPIPRRLRSQPPKTAPTTPIMIVTIIPPGSGPGMTHLASAPAMSPTRIQNIKADITSSHLFFFLHFWQRFLGRSVCYFEHDRKQQSCQGLGCPVTSIHRIADKVSSRKPALPR